MPFIWQRPLVQVVEQGIPFWSRDVSIVLTRKMMAEAEGATRVMKDLAPWRDRTGNARSQLRSFAVNGWPNFVAWYFTHGPDIEYGMYLETMQAGSFAIVVPTAEMYFPHMQRMLAEEGFRTY